MTLNIPRKFERRDLHIGLYEDVAVVLDKLCAQYHCSRTDVLTALLIKYESEDLAALMPAGSKKGTK